MQVSATIKAPGGGDHPLGNTLHPRSSAGVREVRERERGNIRWAALSGVIDLVSVEVDSHGTAKEGLYGNGRGRGYS